MHTDVFYVVNTFQLLLVNWDKEEGFLSIGKYNGDRLAGRSFYSPYLESTLDSFWKFWDAVAGFRCDFGITMSSTNVVIVTFCVVGVFAVNIRYNTSPKTLPCHTPTVTGCKFSALIVFRRSNFCYLLRILLCRTYHSADISWAYITGPSAIPCRAFLAHIYWKGRGLCLRNEIRNILDAIGD